MDLSSFFIANDAKFVIFHLRVRTGHSTQNMIENTCSISNILIRVPQQFIL